MDQRIEGDLQSDTRKYSTGVYGKSIAFRQGKERKGLAYRSNMKTTSVVSITGWQEPYGTPPEGGKFRREACFLFKEFPKANFRPGNRHFRDCPSPDIDAHIQNRRERL